MSTADEACPAISHDLRKGSSASVILVVCASLRTVHHMQHLTRETCSTCETRRKSGASRRKSFESPNEPSS